MKALTKSDKMAYDYPTHCCRKCAFKLNHKYQKMFFGQPYITTYIREPDNERQKEQYKEIMNKIFDYHLNFEVQSRKESVERISRKESIESV